MVIYKILSPLLFYNFASPILLNKYLENHVMEIYRSVTFQSSVKLVIEIYGSVSEAGEFGLSP